MDEMIDLPEEESSYLKAWSGLSMHLVIYDFVFCLC